MKTFFNKLILYATHSTTKYYLTHPIVFITNRIIFGTLMIKRLIKQDINFCWQVNSKLPIDVVMTAVNKDYEVLSIVIDSIRKYIKHPIGKIIIISPKSQIITNLCVKKDCLFIDEDEVLPIKKKDIHYSIQGVDRSGWLFQQLLKYGAEKYCTNQHYLVTEADTIFLRPRVFENNGKMLFPCNNQVCHLPYIYAYTALLGKKILPYVYFTSHHTLIKKVRLSSLKKEIEVFCNKPWYRAIVENIDKSDGSAVSDYETYGQYMYWNFKEEVELEDWNNISLSRKLFPEFEKLSNSYSINYKAASFHSYND